MSKKFSILIVLIFFVSSVLITPASGKPKLKKYLIDGQVTINLGVINGNQSPLNPSISGVNACNLAAEDGLGLDDNAAAVITSATGNAGRIRALKIIKKRNWELKMGGMKPILIKTGDFQCRVNFSFAVAKAKKYQLKFEGYDISKGSNIEFVSALDFYFPTKIPFTVAKSRSFIDITADCYEDDKSNRNKFFCDWSIEFP